MKKWKIFVSHGTPYTAAQERFYAKFKAHIENKGCEVATIGQNKHGVRQPVELAREEIAACDGAAVIAFKRIEILQGIDKPGSSAPASVDGRILPTVWNHLEAAMAYASDLPLLVLVERGLHREGMLSKRFEWDALEIDVTSKVLSDEKFKQRCDHWLSFIEERACKATSKLEIDKLTLKQLLLCLTPAQLWKLLGAALIVLSAVAATAYKLASWIPHARP